MNNSDYHEYAADVLKHRHTNISLLTNPPPARNRFRHATWLEVMGLIESVFMITADDNISEVYDE